MTFLVVFCWNLILCFFNVYFDIQDLSARIMSISQSGSRNICILSANGSISNVTLRQPASSGGTVTYEVRLSQNYIFINYFVALNADSFDKFSVFPVSTFLLIVFVLVSCDRYLYQSVLV